MLFEDFERIFKQLNNRLLHFFSYKNKIILSFEEKKCLDWYQIDTVNPIISE